MDHIIDGHNLISKMPGMSLSMPDDEQHLVEALVTYCQKGGHRIEVFFDGAPPGQVGTRNHGRVRAHFVAQSGTADEAIKRRLARLGRAARNWLVVSSDRSVQQAGREAHAKVISAEEFATRIQAALVKQGKGAAPTIDEPLSDAEVREWEDIFRGKPRPKKP